jgi:hypothetical protein
MVEAMLRLEGLNDEQIKQKFSQEYHYYLRRVRHHIPLPDELEKRYQEVITLFANVHDAKTGKPFFGEKAWEEHTSVLNHIHKNCLSDIPGVWYYMQIGVDSKGLPILKCIRGTSALEGLHQKLWQLIRGFSNSP